MSQLVELMNSLDIYKVSAYLQSRSSPHLPGRFGLRNEQEKISEPRKKKKKDST